MTHRKGAGSKRTVEVTVRRRSLVGPRGVRELGATVYCPYRREALDIESCRDCSRFQGLTGVRLACSAEEGMLEVDGTLGAIAASGTIVVEPETTVEHVRAVVSRLDGAVVAVVSSEGAIRAVVLGRDVVKAPGQAIVSWLAREDIALTVPEGATVHEAARKLAMKRVRRLPIVARDGHVVGTADDLELLRIVARRNE